MISQFIGLYVAFIPFVGLQIKLAYNSLNIFGLLSKFTLAYFKY